MTSKGIVNALQKQNKANKEDDAVKEIEKIDFTADDTSSILNQINKLTEQLEKIERLDPPKTNDNKNTIQNILKVREELKNTLDNIEEVETVIQLHGNKEDQKNVEKSEDEKEKKERSPTTDTETLRMDGTGYRRGGNDQKQNNEGISNDTDADIVSKVIDDITNIQQSSTDIIHSYENILDEYNSIADHDKTGNTIEIFNISVNNISTKKLEKNVIEENAGRIDQLNKSAQDLKGSLDKFLADNNKAVAKLESDFKSSIKPLLSRYYRGTVIASENKKFKQIFEVLKSSQNSDRSTLKTNSGKLFQTIAGYANQVNKAEKDRGAEQKIKVLEDIKVLGRGFKGGDEKKAGDTDQLKKLQEELKKLKRQIEKSAQLKELGNEFGSINDIPDIYTEIYDRYLKNRQDAEMRSEDEQQKKANILKEDEKFLNEMEKHKLLPKYAYKINTTDRLLFIVLIIIIKVLSITVIEYLIDNDVIAGIITSLVIFTTIYLILMTFMLYLINNSGIYLRSLFGYAHLDVNRGGVMLHYTLMLMFLLAIFVIYVNMTINEKEESINSVEEKIELAHRVDMITNIIVVFCAVFVMVI